MSKYPVETSDLDGVIAGVNYLLSGPQSGNQINGNSATFLFNLTGNPRPPYTDEYISVFRPLTIGPISLGTSEMLDERTFKFTFATPIVGDPPFNLGCPIIVKDVVDPVYNQQYGPIGVVECTTDYVIARSLDSFTVASPSTGGTVEFRVAFDINTDTTELVPYIGPIVTPMQAKASVTSISDKVFLTGQFAGKVLYQSTSLTDSELNFSVGIYRTKIINIGTLQNPVLTPEPWTPVFTKQYSVSVAAGSSDSVDFDFIATSCFDDFSLASDPAMLGQYLYYIGMYITTNNTVVTDPSGVGIFQITGNQTAISAQVVKQ